MRQIAGALLLILGSCSPVLAAGEDFCRRYASTALEQLRTGQEAGCPDLRYPVWSDDFSHHYAWCLRVSEAEAGEGTRMRDEVLSDCRRRSETVGEPADARCRGYAETAIDQLRQAREAGCPDLSYPVWSDDFDHHYSWCRRVSEEETVHGTRVRDEALLRCRSSMGSPPSTAPPLRSPGTAAPSQAPPTVSTAAAAASLSSSRLHPRAAMLLSSRIGPSFGDLVHHLRSRESLAALSRGTGLSMEEILFLAHEIDLLAVLGPENVSERELELLKTLEIETVHDLARQTGFEESFHRRLATLAGRSGIPEPSIERVAGWIRRCRETRSSVPAQELMAPAATATAYGPMTTYAADRGGGAEGVITEVTTATVIPSSVLLEIASSQPRDFVIQPGGADTTLDFPAREPGLYRATVQFERNGGTAALRWQVEKPQAVLQFPDRTVSSIGQLGTVLQQEPVRTSVVGYETLVANSSELQEIARYHLYFWVDKRDLPLTGQLRLRLIVASNTAGSRPAGYGIEQSTDPGPNDPTLRGQVAVSRRPIRRLGSFEGSLVLPLRGVDQDLLHVVETPLYQHARETFQLPGRLVFQLSPRPNTYRPPVEMYGKMQSDRAHEWRAVQVRRDEQTVAGRLSNAGGEATYEITDPPTGIYRILVMAGSEPSFEQLATTGYVVGAGGESPIEELELRVHLAGGEKPRMTYVAELEGLMMSSQSETGENDDDDPPGEFRVSTVGGLAQRSSAWSSNGSPVYSHLDTYPSFPEWLSPHPLVIRDSPTGDGRPRPVIFPRMPIISFSDEVAAGYDDLSILVTVTEDDSLTYWQSLGSGLSRIVGVFQAALKLVTGDYSGAVKSFIQQVGNLVRSDLDLEEADDLVGLPGVRTSKESGFGVESDGSFVFEIVGPANDRDMAPMGFPSSGAARGTVFNHRSGGKFPAGAWVRSRIRMRRTPELWGWMTVQLKEFTLREETDEPGKPTNVIVRTGLLGPDLKPGQLGPGVTGSKYPGVWETLKFSARKDQPVTVATSPPPADPRQGFFLGNRHISPGWTSHEYFQIEFWDDDPGGDTFLGMVSHTFYLADFYDHVAELPDQDVNEMDDVLYQHGILSASYRKEGPYYVCEMTVRDPGTWLKEVKLIAHAFLYE